MVVHLPFADVHGFPQVLQVKAELAVSVHTGADVGRSRNAQFPFLVHDIHKGSQLFPGFCKGKFQLGTGLTAFEQQLVIWDLRSPHNSGIRAAELHLFHVQIAAVGKVKLFHAIKSFLKGIPFHHHKTAEAVWCSW